MSPEEKRRRIGQLATKRRRNVPPDYRDISTFKNGRYDVDSYVVPWTKSAHNESADFMVIAQDWASESLLDGDFDEDMARRGHKASLPTNQNLFRLLRDHLGMEFSDTYATDLFPFVKRCRMSARIPFQELVAAAREYAVPQIEIIRPRVVVCLGIGTFSALWSASAEITAASEGRLTWASYAERFPTDKPFRLNDSYTEVYAATHPGAWSAVRKREMDREWRFLGNRISELRNHP